MGNGGAEISGGLGGASVARESARAYAIQPQARAYAPARRAWRETAAPPAPAPRLVPAQPFADRLIQRVRELGHPLCIGIDPHLAMLPGLFRAEEGRIRPGDARAAESVAAFCTALLERCADAAACVKFQSACFEALGPAGVNALAQLMQQARAHGLEVILDAKRGDIGSTAAAYAAAYLAANAPMRADALTVNPWLGADTLQPFIRQAAQNGAGVFVLLKTSNPGSALLQNRIGQDGAPLHLHLARALAECGDGDAAALRGAAGYSGLGAVVGAPHPQQARALRAALPRALFLVPGYGAQGASAADAVAGFVPHGGRLEGGVVNSSRGICFAPEAQAAQSARAWEAAVDAAIGRAAAELQRACAAA